MLDLALITLALTGTVQAHSWMQCTKWVFNNQAALTNPAQRLYSDSDGYCDGYPRNYPIGYKINGVPAIFGTEDGAFGMPGYFQSTLDSQSCANTASFPPQDQSYKADPSSQYAPSTYAGYNLGKMATYTAGETVCIRWPAKNHFDNIPVAENVKEVYMYMRKADSADPSTQRSVVAQSTLVANFWFRKCPVAGVPTSGDQAGPGSNTRPCGDCFTVPTNLTPGRYFLQWYWRSYTTCSDVMVKAASGTGTTASSTPSPSRSPSSNSPVSAASPTPSPTASPAVASNNGVRCGYGLAWQGGNGFGGKITCTFSSVPTTSWVVTVTWPDGTTATAAWGAALSNNGQTSTFTNLGYNLQSQSVEIGFNGQFATSTQPTSMTASVDGSAARSVALTLQEYSGELPTSPDGQWANNGTYGQDTVTTITTNSAPMSNYVGMYSLIICAVLPLLL